METLNQRFVVREVSALCQALYCSEQAVEITEELYNHFLEVLPPVRMDQWSFTFKEGTDSRRFFKEGDKHFCELEMETLVDPTFTVWISIVKDIDADICIQNIVSGDETDVSHLTQYIGKTFKSVFQISRTINVPIRM